MVSHKPCDVSLPRLLFVSTPVFSSVPLRDALPRRSLAPYLNEKSFQGEYLRRWTSLYCNHRQNGEDLFAAELRSVSSFAPITAITRPLPPTLLLYSRFCSVSHLLEMSAQDRVLRHISVRNQNEATTRGEGTPGSVNPR